MEQRGNKSRFSADLVDQFRRRSQPGHRFDQLETMFSGNRIEDFNLPGAGGNFGRGIIKLIAKFAGGIHRLALRLLQFEFADDLRLDSRQRLHFAVFLEFVFGRFVIILNLLVRDLYIFHVILVVESHDFRHQLRRSHEQLSILLVKILQLLFQYLAGLVGRKRETDRGSLDLFQTMIHELIQLIGNHDDIERCALKQFSGRDELADGFFKISRGQPGRLDVALDESFITLVIETFFGVEHGNPLDFGNHVLIGNRDSGIFSRRLKSDIGEDIGDHVISELSGSGGIVKGKQEALVVHSFLIVFQLHLFAEDFSDYRIRRHPVSEKQRTVNAGSEKPDERDNDNDGKCTKENLVVLHQHRIHFSYNHDQPLFFIVKLPQNLIMYIAWRIIQPAINIHGRKYCTIFYPAPPVKPF